MTSIAPEKVWRRSDFLANLFNFYNFLFLIPFSVEYDDLTSQYSVKGSRFLKKIVTFIFHSVLLFIEATFILDSNWERHSNSSLISGLFEFVSHFSTCILVIVSLKFMWFDQRKVQRLLECTQTTVLTPRRSAQLKILMTSVGALLFICHILQHIELAGGLFRYFNWRQPLSSSLYITEGTFTNGTEAESVEDPSAFQVISNIWVRLYIILMANIVGYFFFNHLTFLTLALSLYMMAKEFSKDLMEARDDVYRSIDLYLNIKARIKEINSIIGPQILPYYFGVMTYCVVSPDIFKGFKDKSPFEKFFFIYIGFSFGFWVVSAHSHEMLHNAHKKWREYHVFQNSKLAYFPRETRLKLEEMKGDLDGGSMELSISSKYFAVTNGFLCTMLGVIVTYGIIIFQLQPPAPESQTT